MAKKEWSKTVFTKLNAIQPMIPYFSSKYFTTSTMVLDF